MKRSRSKAGYEWRLTLAVTGSVAVVFFVLLFLPFAAPAATLGGEAHTILRLREAADDRNFSPLYEYLNFGGEDTSGRQGALTYDFGGWGRVDLGDKRLDNRTDAVLQHGYIGYRGDKNNLFFQAGRQFVVEGVATERLDGLYLRSDLKAGFTAAAFVGAPVTTETDFQGGDILYGGRIAHTRPRFYTIGLSALRNDDGSSHLREEQGLDLWLRPFEMLDIVGRSSRNGITSGWMEHSYNFLLAPLPIFQIQAGVSRISYRDYFHHVTTNALRLATGLIDPREKVLTLGGSVDFGPFNNFSISLDYKDYDYELAGPAKYYGGKATYLLPAGAILAGFSAHRMDGDSDRLQFAEYRIFASKKIGKADLTADLFEVHYDSPINGVKNTYAVAAAVAYDIARQWKAAADIEYGKTVDFDRQVSGLLKLSYYFDVQLGTEGRARSEK